MRSITDYDETVELRHLVSFEAVARCGGFTRAAQDLHIAQPAVSGHIKRLERELGVQLLHRSRGAQLSAAGEVLLPFVREALADLEEGRRQVRAFRAVQSGHVAIGATPVTGGLDLVQLLAGFRNRYPGVSVALRVGLIAPLLQDLRAGTLDVVIGPLEQDVDGLRRYELVPEHLVLITAPGDRRRVRSLRDVADDPFICLPADSGLRRLLDDGAAAAGAAVTVSFETHSPGSIRELVSAGLGSALVAASAVAGPGPQVRVHELPGLPPHSPICAMSAINVDPPVARFLEDVVAWAHPGP